MKVTDILDKGSVLGEIASRDKKGVLEELVSVLVEDGKLKEKEKPLQVLLEREKLGSTGIGDGVALPHGKLNGIGGVICSFGRSRKGVDFGAIDHKPSHLFFLLLAPEDSAGEHLQALARLSRLLKDIQFRKRLIDARTADDLYAIIAEEDDRY
jgi:PTS system nitrogen regulatory IIA component